MFRSSTEYSASISSQYTESVSREMSDYMEKLNQSFDNLFSNTDFQRFLATPADNLTKQVNEIIGFRPIIKNALQFHPDVLGVLYLDQLGKSYFYSNQKTLDASFNFKSDSLYNNVFAAASPELLPPHPMNYILYAKDRVFSYVWPIVNLNTGETESWFIIEIKEEKLSNMLGGSEAGGQLSLYHAPSQTNIATGTPLPENVLSSFHQEMMQHEAQVGHFLFAADKDEYEVSFHQLHGSDASFHIDSSQGTGTTVRMIVPVDIGRNG